MKDFVYAHAIGYIMHELKINKEIHTMMIEVNNHWSNNNVNN
jgi:hypothetical protein